MNVNILLWIIFLPFAASIITFLIPEGVKGVREGISLAVCLVTIGLSFYIFKHGEILLSRAWIPALKINFSLRAYPFSSFVLIFCNLFGVVISLYSIKFMQGKPKLNEYYTYLLIAVGASSGAVLANDLVLLLVFWGIVLLTLFGLLAITSAKVAAKGLFIIGFSDFCLILGVVFIWMLTKTFAMNGISKIGLTSGLAIWAFILLMIGAIAKAGAMPFHTWIPDAALEAHVPIMAFMPASLDKLLGIYLLARICMDFFNFIPNSALSILVMVIGAFTIIAAVMMALVQHNLTKLLSYHAISQVGYMVLGIGTGVPIGIAGGIFHMVNHAIYKCCLFLTGGSVEHKVKTTDMSGLGGLSKIIPIAFVTCVIAAMSISGVPPFNGFFSKWMVYQGVIEAGKMSGGGAKLWILWLVAAMFGSGLTLASFLKVLHGTFLGQPRWKAAKRGENFSMATPQIILAALCIVFGVFAYRVPLKFLIFPSIGKTVSPLGFWSPGLATFFIIIGIAIGGIIYLLSKVRVGREDSAFIGGEVMTSEMKVSGVEFYDTVKEQRGVSTIYGKALKGAYDFYNWGVKFFKGVAYFVWVLGDRAIDYIWIGLYKAVLGISNMSRKAHTGVLTSYLLWMLVALAILLIVVFYS